MIQKIDLRIGNFVKYDGRIYKVSGITNNWVYLREDMSLRVSLETLSPILITKDVFESLELNFNGNLEIQNKSRSGDSTYINLNSKILNQKGISVSCGYYVEAPTALNHIKYLHQLQNLYYSLSGEDLEVNIDKELHERDQSL